MQWHCKRVMFCVPHEVKTFLRVVAKLDLDGVEAFVYVGNNLPVSAITPTIEAEFGKPLIGVNVATY